MSFFDLDPRATQNLLDQARLNPLTPDDIKPGWWAGAWKAPVTGLASVWNDAALLLGDAVTPPLRNVARPVDEMFGTKLDDWLASEQQKAVDNIKGWAPDPRTTGVIGQAVHGLFNIIPEAIPGPEVAATLQGYKAMRGGMADGLDPGTALGVGAINAVSTWVGLKLPMQVLPKYGAAGAVATGAGGNIAVGAASRGGTGEWLRANGYGEMADQYKVLDSSAIATDLILGGGFGALAHYGPGVAQRYEAWREGPGKQIQPSDVDTALTLNNQLHVELDTAPGIPATPQARAAHVQMVQDALAALARDERVVAHPDVAEAQFLENPTAARAREQVVEAVEDYLGPEWRALKAELEARGLPTDEIDMSGPARVAAVPEPEVFYHGTNKEFAEFDPTIGSTPGAWFTKAAEDAAGFGRVSAYTVDVKRPATMADLAAARREAAAAGFDVMTDRVAFNRAVIAALEAKGFDGIRDGAFAGAGGKGANVIAALRPEQIKPVAKESASEMGAPLRRADSDENARGGASSQAAQDGSMSGTLPSETGMPSTSKNSTEGGKAGNFIDFTSEGSLPDLASVGKIATGDAEIGVILQDHPTMRIPGDDGAAVPASVELARADAEIARAEQDSQGFAAAVACALRG